jgi:hypothetical protein
MDIKLKAQVTCVSCGATDEASVLLPWTIEIDRVPMTIDLQVETKFVVSSYRTGYVCQDCVAKGTK